MTQPKTKYPSAFYAAAGVGDLVYEQLRKLQTKAIAYGNEQAPEWKRRVADFSVKVDAGKVRETVVTGTQVAAERATKVYGTLVARGEKAFADETGPKSEAKSEAKSEPKSEPKSTAKSAAVAVAAKDGAPKDGAPKAATVQADAPVAKKAAAPRKKAA